MNKKIGGQAKEEELNARWKGASTS